MEMIAYGNHDSHQGDYSDYLVMGRHCELSAYPAKPLALQIIQSATAAIPSSAGLLHN